MTSAMMQMPPGQIGIVTLLSNLVPKPPQTRINQALEKERGKLTKNDVGVLVYGLKTASTDKCAAALLQLATERPELFQGKQVDILLAFTEDKTNFGLENRSIGILSELALKKPELFDKDDVRVLIVGLHNRNIRDGCAEALAYLADGNPSLFRKDEVVEFVAGLANESTASGCAAALGNLAKAGIMNGNDIASIAEGMMEHPGHGDMTNNGFVLALFYVATRASAPLAAKAFDELIQGTRDEKTSRECIKAVDRAAMLKPNLFSKEDVAVLFEGLQKGGRYDSICGVLEALAEVRPGLFDTKDCEFVLEESKKDSQSNSLIAASFTPIVMLLKQLIEGNAQFREGLLARYDGLDEKTKEVLAKANATKFHLENADRLEKEFHITRFTRYPESILSAMLSGPVPGKPLAVVAYNKSDPTGGFYSNHLQQLKDAGYQVVVFECENETEFAAMATRISKQWGKASAFIIGGHGTPKSIRLGIKTGGEKDLLDITDTDILAQMNLWLAKGAQIVLEACSTAKKGEAATIADTIFKYTWVEDTQLFAPPLSTTTAIYTIGKTDNGPYIQDIKYEGSITEDATAEDRTDNGNAAIKFKRGK